MKSADFVQIRSVYEHYKGNKYKVLAIAKHSETLEDHVVYQDLKDSSKIWVRPLKMFLEYVDIERLAIPRFKPDLPPTSLL